jgi:hypothetical protein
MRKIKSAVAAAAACAGMLAPLLVLGASAANAESVYTISYINRCMDIKVNNLKPPTFRDYCYHLGAYSTYSQTQIWINGHVSCYGYNQASGGDENGSANITWCGVGGGNGTAVLNIGANVTYSGIAGSYYERMNIYSGGAGCSTWGSNSAVNGIYTWWNDGYGPGGYHTNNGVVCEYSA